MSELENKYKPFPFWSWNDELDPKELVKQINWMHDNGIGGFFMHARGGLTTPYLGKKWFKCVEACLKRSKELNMEGYAYDENGWPSGFAGGKLLEDDYNKDAFLTYKIGEYDKKSFVSYSLDGNTLKRTTEGKNCLNVYMSLSTCTADICNEKVVRKFIDLTHEQYKKHDKYHNLKGFFTDEPQYYRWGTPWTRVLPEYFEKKYGEDILNGLGLLFVEKEGYRAFRYKYWKSMQDLMLNSYSKQIYDWCNQNNYKLTGHYVEESSLGYQIACCGGVMPFYEYEHIPGVDWLGRDVGSSCLTPKQLGSVSSQLDKKQSMAELFACAGWDATPNELKLIAEYLMVGGVNLLCHHLLPYSEHGQRKRDYPEHYSKINPWVDKNFKEFNDYFSNLGKTLSDSKEIVNVGILNPITSCYFEYKRDANCFNVENIDNAFTESLNSLSDKQIPFHIIDETILRKHGRVEDKSLVVGQCTYDFIVLPKIIYTMDKTTESMLYEYINNGGKVLLMGDKPTYLEGESFDYSYLQSNTSFEEIIDHQDFSASETTHVSSTYRIDENGNKFIYLVNLGESCDIKFKLKGFKSFKCDDKVISTNLHLDKYESKLLYFSNENIDTVKPLKELHLNTKFNIEDDYLNYICLDSVSYSKDNISYSPIRNVMAAFNELLESRYNGKLYLKYRFNVEKVPQNLTLLIEDTHLKNVKVNGVKVKKIGTVLEKQLLEFDIAKTCKVGNNEVVAEINFFENETVYYALYGENVNESLRNCLAYPTTIEAVYLRGNFGVSGDFKNSPNLDTVLIGNNFKITEQKKVIEDAIKDGLPFFRGNITLSQEIELKDTDYELVLNRRFHLIDVYVNGSFAGRMMFKNKLDISKYLINGKNKIKLVITFNNRNLLGPFHTNEEEAFAVGPYSWERIGLWKDGKSSLFKEDYAFVKTFVSKD